ncbi:unnamed protein product [Adineta steineri]|uniref:Uncharacterized protein n=1 Tax=Adineta steineri TaxID=433720 RepID=A0A815MLR3_9BILA|nr:unnamed protein product [Adineta steineri]CAF1619859.1 unnamed protein product [Adineta steineri]
MALAVIITVHPSNARDSSYFQASRRHIDRDQLKRMLMNYVSRNAVEESDEDNDLLQKRDNTVIPWTQLSSAGWVECYWLSSVYDKTTTDACKQACLGVTDCNAVNLRHSEHRCDFEKCTPGTQKVNADADHEAHIMTSAREYCFCADA